MGTKGTKGTKGTWYPRKTIELYIELTKHIYWMGRLPYWSNDYGNRKKGQIAGCITDCGYRIIGINKCHVYAHRLHYYMVNGELPAKLDHRNRDKDDNRIENLRTGTDSEHSMNKDIRCNNTSGTTGVHWKKSRNKWVAIIGINNKKKHLGLFKSKEKAIEARLEAEKLYYKEWSPNV